MSYESKVQLLFDAASGQYIPQRFFRECLCGWGPNGNGSPSPWHGYNWTECEAHLSDPENEWYWDQWQTVLDNAYAIITDENGNQKKFTLVQDGDVWLVSEDMTDEDWEEWGIF